MPDHFVYHTTGCGCCGCHLKKGAPQCRCAQTEACRNTGSCLDHCNCIECEWRNREIELRRKPTSTPTHKETS